MQYIVLKKDNIFEYIFYVSDIQRNKSKIFFLFDKG